MGGNTVPLRTVCNIVIIFLLLNPPSSTVCTVWYEYHTIVKVSTNGSQIRNGRWAAYRNLVLCRSVRRAERGGIAPKGRAHETREK